MTTIGEAISRIRNIVKAVKQDAFLTDRFIYSLILKHGKLLMRRQDNLNRIMNFDSVHQTLDFVNLIEVDKAQAGCVCVYAGCYFKRTKDKLPTFFEGYNGPLIRAVTSLDISQKLERISPTTYSQLSSIKTFKYNKVKYYWYMNDYLYFADFNWDAVRIEGVFEGDISSYNCDTSDNCEYIQNKKFMIPEFLFTEIEQLVFKDLGLTLQIPQDLAHDNKNVVR